MSYQVIARKYRPQRFNDVVGQEHVTQTLHNAVKQNRIAHAYLFVGPRGTGKTTIARIFAKCLNCTGGPSVEFKDDDPRVVEIAEGRSMDVMEIDGASNRGIEEIRQLRETIHYTPAAAKFKIYIIDEVHMLTKEAFNALLKTLEEPPEHVKFMFATTEPEKVLATILSRCQRYDLRRIPVDLIIKHLAHIAKLEEVEIEEAALHAIARGAEGCMRDAESALDQLISFCGNRIVETDVLAMFGLTARDQIHSLVQSVLTGKMETALRQLNELAKGGKDLGRFLSDLLNHLRNLLIYQVADGDLSLLETSETEAGVLKQQAGLVSNEALTRIMEVIADCESRLRDAASKKILVEVSLLKAIQARNAVNLDTVLKQLQGLRSESISAAGEESTLPVGGAVKPAARTTKAPARSPIKTEKTSEEPAPTAAPASSQSVSTAASTTAKPADDLESFWSQVVTAVGQTSPFARSYLDQAHPVSWEGKTLTIGFAPENADGLGLANNSKNRTLIQTKLAEMGYPGAQVKFVQSEAPQGWSPPVPAPEEPKTPSPAASSEAASAQERAEPAAKAARPAKKDKTESKPVDMDEFKNDPLIKEALEIFKGQIVDIRSSTR